MIDWILDHCNGSDSRKSSPTLEEELFRQASHTLLDYKANPQGIRWQHMNINGIPFSLPIDGRNQ